MREDKYKDTAVKTFIGKDSVEAMMKLRLEFGSEAMILETTEYYEPTRYFMGIPLPWSREKRVAIKGSPNMIPSGGISREMKNATRTYSDFTALRTGGDSAGTLSENPFARVSSRPETPKSQTGLSDASRQRATRPQESPATLTPAQAREKILSSSRDLAAETARGFSQPPSHQPPSHQRQPQPQPQQQSQPQQQHRPQAPQQPRRGADRKSPAQVIEQPSMDMTVKPREQALATDTRELRQEIEGMKKLLLDLVNNTKKSSGGKGPFQHIRKILERNELAREHVTQIMDDLEKELDDEEQVDRTVVLKHVYNWMVKSTKTSRPMSLSEDDMRVISIIGPTGVGKTTTLVKLATLAWKNFNCEIAFITVDTFRIGAPTQLEKYAEILEVPVCTVFSPKDLREAISDLRSKGVQMVFIDTFGISPADNERLIDIKAFLASWTGIQTILAVSATTKYNDMLKIVNCFEGVGFSDLIVTKLDETTTYGPVMSLLTSTRIPLIYTTCGQEVVGKINEANIKKIAAKVVFDRGSGLKTHSAQTVQNSPSAQAEAASRTEQRLSSMGRPAPSSPQVGQPMQSHDPLLGARGMKNDRSESESLKIVKKLLILDPDAPISMQEQPLESPKTVVDHQPAPSVGTISSVIFPTFSAKDQD